MEEITVSAKTLDDAITEALIQLGVTSDKLDYDVIEKGSSGFLGIGAKQAVVKARRKVEEEPVKEEVREEIICSALSFASSAASSFPPKAIPIVL